MEKKQETEKNDNNFSFMFNYVKKEKFKVLISLIFSVLNAILIVVPYYLIYKIIAIILSNNIDISEVKRLAIIGGVAMTIKVLFMLTSGAFSHISAYNILYDIRVDTMKHLSELNMGFFMTNSIGTLKKSINEDVEKIENFLAHQLPDLFAAAAVPIVYSVFLFAINWQLTLVLWLLVAGCVFFQVRAFADSSARMEKYNFLNNKLNSIIVQYINGMNVFKAFNLTAKNFKIYKDTNEEYRDYWIEMTEKATDPWINFLVLTDSALIFILPIGGFMFLTNRIDASVFTLFILISTVFLTSFKSLLEFGGQLAHILGGLNNVRKIINTPVQSSNEKYKDLKLKGEIEFKNVTFKYIDKVVIDNLSLKLEKNKQVALVGPSGSGKTTLGVLLGRFWDVENGSIEIDGININEIPVETLLNNMAFVFQDVFMLQDTIYNNILMEMDKTKEEVEYAAKKAQIHDFIISLPNGYDTVLGETGIKLSGGQKQRISIARAILKDAPILVLDEITSYSDIENESKIQIALRELLKDKTVLIIAHRLYTIKNSDNIVVLDKGKIIEQGKHEKLMDNNALYRYLWDIYNFENKGGEINV